MFHFFTIAGGVFNEDVHAWRGPSTTFTIDDFVGPVQNLAAAAAGLPYLKGGICEVGGSFPLLNEAETYGAIPNSWGKQHKDLMRTGLIRRHIAGLSMVGEDMPQLANRVDLDPDIRDVYGFPVPRITHSAHRFEIASSAYFGPQLAALCQAAPGALTSFVLPVATLTEASGPGGPFAGIASTAHIMGTARSQVGQEVRLLLHVRQAGRRHVLSHDDRGHEVQDQEGRRALHRDAGERGNLHELL